MHETAELCSSSPLVAATCSEGPVVRTLVTLENSNCTWCHNAMLATLREKDGVHRVRSELSSGCLIVDHEGEPDALLAVIATADLAVAVAGNGEREMVGVDGHEAVACRAEMDIVVAPPGEESHPLAAMKPDGSGDNSSNSRSPSDTSSPAVPVCPVCHPWWTGRTRGSATSHAKATHPRPGPTGDPVRREGVPCCLSSPRGIPMRPAG